MHVSSCDFILPARKYTIDLSNDDGVSSQEDYTVLVRTIREIVNFVDTRQILIRAVRRSRAMLRHLAARDIV